MHNVLDAARYRHAASLVAALTGWPVEEILGRRRLADIVHVRHATWRAVEEAYGWGPSRLANAAGVDHTSIIHAKKRPGSDQSELIAAVVEALDDDGLAVVDAMIERLVVYRERLAREAPATPPPRPATPATPYLTAGERDMALIKVMRGNRRVSSAP